jgi:hypothetical protein
VILGKVEYSQGGALLVFLEEDVVEVQIEQVAKGREVEEVFADLGFDDFPAARAEFTP